ncbi:MAG: hypothetical protein ABEJ07_02595 [Candidatus Nanohaloarchaea archaeon]
MKDSYEEVLDEVAGLEGEQASRYLTELAERLDARYDSTQQDVQDASTDINGIEVMEATENPYGLSALREQMMYDMIVDRFAADTEQFADNIHSLHQELQRPHQRSRPEKGLEDLVTGLFYEVLEETR